mmetsp:Transcript_26646/g.49050  ORF Transcript_26646/g.49050 Transcript_26646/m.49050 type:complete len:155 (+) Transcript_26646:226-690(+)
MKTPSYLFGASPLYLFYVSPPHLSSARKHYFHMCPDAARTSCNYFFCNHFAAVRQLSLPWVRTWLLPSASSTVSMQHTNLIASAIFLLPARLWSPLHLHQQRKVASMCCQCQKFSQASKYVKRSRFLLYQFLNHLDHWKTDGQMITLGLLPDVC